MLQIIIITIQLITETINSFFSVVNFLKYVVTEVVLFSSVAFKTLTFHKVYSVATYLRCGGIFSKNITNGLLIQTVK